MNNFSNNRSIGGGAFGLIIAGLVFALLPMFLPDKFVSGTSSAILLIFGIVLMTIGIILFVMAKLYVKTPANQAFIRTGLGGPKVIIDGGAVFISMFHELTRISLETMKLVVVRSGKESIITKDKLRADVTAEFYIKVPKDPTGIVNAATSLGGRAMTPENVKELVEEKLVSALRSSGAASTLAQLHEERETFAKSVFDGVVQDLEKNGLVLESVTISKLDQAPLASFDESNVFDAEGARTIAEITTKFKVEKNKLEREGEQQIGSDTLSTQKILNDQQVENEESGAERDKKIKVLKATKDREAEESKQQEEQKSEEARIAKEKNVGLKEVEKKKEIESANIEKAKTIESANIEKAKTIESANIEKDKTIKSAEIDKQKAIVDKEAEKATADKAKADAEAGAKESEQKVITVVKKAEADRAKEVSVIEQQAKAEQKKIEENNAADILAYQKTKEAEAEKEAAENKATAIKTVAAAEKEAAISKAEGQKAEAMIPVDVEKARVEVRQADVEVTGKELGFKAQFQEVSIRLTLGEKQIEADKEIGVAMATAMGTALGSANMNIWGDASTVTQMMKFFTDGQGQNIKLQALMNGGEKNTTTVISEETKELLTSYLKGQKTAMEVMGAADNVSEEVKALITEFVKSGGANTMTGLGLMLSSLSSGKEVDPGMMQKIQELAQQFMTDDKK